MAGIVGTFFAQVARPAINPFLSAELNELTEVVSKFDTYATRWSSFVARYGVFRVNPANRWPLRAQRIGQGFFDDFYNRIYFIPATLDAGNLLSTQQRHIILWNAFLRPVTLEAAGLGPQSGISMTPPFGVSIPYEIPPLRELDFTVQIELTGPPTIDSYAYFDVDGISYNVPITGRRIVLFPFAPTWASPFDETVLHRSWVIPAIDGSEQTGSESGEVPRRSFEFSINLRSAHAAQRCENLLFAWQSRFFGVPHWGEESRLDAAAAQGTATLIFDTLGLSLEPGSLIALWRDEEVNEIREIETVDAGGVTLTAALSLDWPEGGRVYPCFVGLMNNTMTGNRETSTIARMAVAFDCEPSVTPGNTPLDLPPLTYRNRELYLGRLNWLSAMPFVYTSDSIRVDSNTGKFSAYTSSGFSKPSRRHNWTMYDRGEIMDFRRFLGRRQGVARSAFMPSGNHDFTMVASILASEATLTVESNEYGTLVGAHPARRDIFIRLRDGRYFCRRVVDTDSFDTFTRLQMDAPLGVDVNLRDVEMISFLSLYRFESPATTIRYLSNSKAVAEAMLVTKMTED